MSVVIAPLGRDDPGFIALVNRVLARVVARFRPRDAFVIQTVDPFGDRWCGTGGHFLGKRGAQTVVSREVPTLPPFPPERITFERSFRLALDLVSYVVNPDSEPLHVSGLKGRDYQRELSRFTEAGIFLWYSGGTVELDRGTLMLQVHTPEFGDVWHATFARARGGWEFEKGLGVSRDEFAA